MLVYSTSKGLSAMTLALAHSRGWLDYDERVTTYWPEFGQAGKEEVTMRQLLGHEAGLPVIDEPLDPSVLADFDRLAAVIARQRPLWPPGTRHGYHGVSLGWYEGELIRRVDPERRTLGRFFAEEIAAPLGLDVHFGVPDDVARRAHRPHRARPAAEGAAAAPPPAAADGRWRCSTRARSASGPSPTRACASPADLDRQRVPAARVPGGRRRGRRARHRPRLRRLLAAPRAELGLTPATLEELTRFPSPPPRGWHDEVLKVDTAFSLGFVRPLARVPLRLERARLRPSRRRRLVRLRRPRPRRVLRLRDEPARLPPQRRPAREGAAGRALPLPLIRGSTRRRSLGSVRDPRRQGVGEVDAQLRASSP